MKIFDDMAFSGSPDALRQFIDSLDPPADIGPWTRDPAAEQSHASIRPAPETDRCFRTHGQSGFPDALLWLFPKEKEARVWRVTNIVPAASNAALGEDLYFDLLRSFRESTLPLARKAGVTISEPQLNVGPEYWLTPEQERLFSAFSRYANRSTGAAHPQDRKRWNAFVISVNREGSSLCGADLERILVEHDRWPEAAASELAILFDHERALLSDYAKSA